MNYPDPTNIKGLKSSSNRIEKRKIRSLSRGTYLFLFTKEFDILMWLEFVDKIHQELP